MEQDVINNSIACVCLIGLAKFVHDLIKQYLQEARKREQESSKREQDKNNFFSNLLQEAREDSRRREDKYMENMDKFAITIDNLNTNMVSIKNNTEKLTERMNYIEEDIKDIKDVIKIEEEKEN